MEIRPPLVTLRAPSRTLNHVSSMNRQTGEDYLRQYPRFKKWIVRCMACGQTGYRLDLPEETTTRMFREEIPTAAAQNIRKFFRPLVLDQNGLCDQCSAASNKSSGD